VIGQKQGHRWRRREQPLAMPWRCQLRSAECFKHSLDRMSAMTV
jgi:hypothetical protein